jgi:hypothetical protein
MGDGSHAILCGMAALADPVSASAPRDPRGGVIGCFSGSIPTVEGRR